MQVSEQELRQLVRDAIARHTGQPATRSAEAFALPAAAVNSLSFGKFLALTPSEDGQCVIEPAVRCNHCAYCQSYGH